MEENGLKIIETFALPNTPDVWEALYPELIPRNPKANRRLLYAMFADMIYWAPFGLRKYIRFPVLFMDEPIIMYIVSKKEVYSGGMIGRDQSKGEAAQKILSDLKGEWKDLYPTSSTVPEGGHHLTIRRRITLGLLDMGVPSGLLPIRHENPDRLAPKEAGITEVIHGFVHVPDLKDTIATVERLQEALAKRMQARN